MNGSDQQQEKKWRKGAESDLKPSLAWGGANVETLRTKNQYYCKSFSAVVEATIYSIRSPLETADGR